MGKDIFRRKCLRSLGLDTKDGISNYELSQRVTDKGGCLTGIPASSVYNWLEGRSKVPGTAALLISIFAG